jgi:hypothetical protein
VRWFPKRRRDDDRYDRWLDFLRMSVADARTMGPWEAAVITTDHEHCHACWVALGTSERCFSEPESSVLCPACFEAFIAEPKPPAERSLTGGN